ncbi:MAG: DMT family transporter [Candidatus Aenigmarchaeota archaeon]|nr:DMT family transporter [Candidatus Aenigmarchaeota archaeon]
MKDEVKGSILIILAMFIFGSMGLFVRFVPTSTITLLFFMQVFASITLFFLLKSVKENIKIKTALKFLVILAIVAVANDLFYFNAFRLTTISNAILTHYTAPVFVALLAPFLIKEKLEKSTLIALVLSFSGLFIIVYSGLSLATSSLGIMFGIVSGLFYALVIIVYKHILKGLSVLHMMLYRYVISALILFPFVMLEAPAINASILVLLFITAMIFTVASSLIHAFGIKHVKAQHAGILGYLEPVAGTTYAFFLLSEVPTAFTFVGGALIILGGYLAIKSQ